MKRFGVILFIFLALSAVADRDVSVQCANLIYAGTHTSRCFSDAFLSEVQKKTAIKTERRFKSVKLDSNELFKYPFIVMTGENNFFLKKKERENLKHYLENGGFLLASAGCSNKDFDTAFRRELKRIFKERKLETIPMSHPIFSTLNKITKITTKSDTGGVVLLEGMTVNDKLVLVYSREGLNNTANTKDCCCCGGNEIKNSLELNVNILVYALLH